MGNQALVIDDNPVILKLVSEILKKHGYAVRNAEDGLIALNILEEYSPDIIFVDLVIPKISGEMLCKIIRSKNQLKDSYLIILSGIAVEAKIDLDQLGVDACIAKGQKIESHITEVLNNIKKGDLRDKQSKSYGIEDFSAHDATLGLLDRKNHLEVILANLSDGLAEVTSEGIIIFANSAAEILLSKPQDQLLGSNFFNSFTGENHQSAISLFKKAQQNSCQASNQPFAINKRFVTLKIFPLEKGPSRSCIIIMHDITERLIAENALIKSEEHFRDLIENTTDLVQNIAPDGRFLYVNRAWKNTLGYNEKDLSNLEIQDIIDPHHLAQCMLTFSEVIHGGRTESVETTFISKDSRKIQVLGSASCRFENGQPVYTRGIFRDITKRKLLEEQLQRSLVEFESIFENSLVGIYHISLDRTVISCNRRAAEMSGYTQEELIGSQCKFLYLSEEHFHELGVKTGEVLEGEMRHVEFPFKHKNGRIIWCLLSAKTIDPDDLERGIILISDDITERKALEEKLKLLATTDELTGAYNRRAFDGIFAKELSRTKRYTYPLSLILFDIDHFKKVNDTLGHDIGDRVLQRMTEISMKQIRLTDSLIRWGGEEFIVLLPHTNINEGMIVAERLREAMEQSDFSTPWKITISLGLSMYRPNDDAETLVKRADIALYQAKQNGRNRVVMTP